MNKTQKSRLVLGLIAFLVVSLPIAYSILYSGPDFHEQRGLEANHSAPPSAQKQLPLTTATGPNSQTSRVSATDESISHIGITLFGRVWYGGSPCTDKSFQIRLTSKSSNKRQDFTFSVELDQTGRFIYEPIPSAAERIQSDILVSLSTGQGPQDRLEIPIRLSGEWLKGANDLGDIVFSPRPLLAAGNVKSLDGAPVVGLNLVFNTVGVPFDKNSKHTRRTCQTDSFGRFQIRSAFHPNNTYRATLDRSSFQLLSSPKFSPGAIGIELVVDTRRFEVSGSVLLDEFIPKEELRVLLIGSSKELPTPNYSTEIGSEGAFHFPTVFGANRTLLVVQRASLSGWLSYPMPLDLNRIATQGTSRIAPIDLRSQISVFEVTCNLQNGSPASGASVSRFLDTPQPITKWNPIDKNAGSLGRAMRENAHLPTQRSATLDHKGTISLLTLKGKFSNYIIRGKGHLQATIIQLKDNLTITLGALQELRVFAPIAAEVQSPYSIRIELRRPGKSFNDPPDHVQSPDESGFSRFEIDATQDYKVLLVLMRSLGNRRFECPLLRNGNFLEFATTSIEKNGPELVAIEGPEELNYAMARIEEMIGKN